MDSKNGSGESGLAISVVMPCHNSDYHLERVLRAYDAQDCTEPFEVIAIDDFSTDETFQILREFQPNRFRLLAKRQDPHLGPGAARNLGLKEVTSPIVLFVGDDILPRKDFVRRHLQVHRVNPSHEIAVLGKVIWPDDMPVNTLMEHITGIGAQQFSYHYLRDGKEYDYRHFYTANISIKNRFLDSVDPLFDPDFIFPAFEDIELAYRLSKKGLRIVYSSGPVGSHYHYHTIWSFSQRQYRAGLMACVIDLKHPWVVGKYPRIYRRYGFVVSLLQGVAQRVTRKKTIESSILEELVLSITSKHEWFPNRFLDRLYIGVLEYFWKKGVITGVLRNNRYLPAILRVHANQTLVPIIGDYHSKRLRD